MTAEDIPAVSDLVARVFNEVVAPEYSAEGVQEFQRYIAPTAFQARLRGNHFSLIALVQTKIIGMIEMRDCNHISLLFVDGDFQRNGIAKELFRRAIRICQEHEPQPSEVSVNSSTFAVPVYEKLDFHKVSERQVKNGIGFIPMVLKLSDQNSL